MSSVTKARFAHTLLLQNPTNWLKMRWLVGILRCAVFTIQPMTTCFVLWFFV